MRTLTRSPRPVAAKPARSEGAWQRPLAGAGAPDRAEDRTSRDGAWVPPLVSEAVRSPGRPLDPGTRAFMEPRFGYDFSGVRVHTDGKAAESAQAVGARAYALGSDVVFAEGQYAPGVPGGRKLLAHELAHVARPGWGGDLHGDERQAEAACERVIAGDFLERGFARAPLPPGQRRPARQALEGYETKPIVFERSDIETLVGQSYWENKVAAEFALTFVNPVKARFAADKEERDAVLSVLLQRRPSSPIRSEKVVLVSIPARTSAPASKKVLYTFTFTPAPRRGGKEGVVVGLQAEGPQATVSVAGAAAPGYSPPSVGYSHKGFPGNADGPYWATHPDEHKQLFSWMENAPGTSFDQVVTTSEAAPRGKTHESSFHVKGTKDSAGHLAGLTIDFLGETLPVIDNPPAGYAGKDKADLQLEELQAKPTDKLGVVSGLDTQPADERLSVKYAIWQYFAGGTRNKEVDVVIPIAGKAIRVLYTLRFQATSNDVSVERVGLEGSSAKLTANALNIERVEGFAAHSANPAAFRSWIGQRYRSVTLKGTTLPELEDSVNREMVAGAGTAAWFQANYGVEILDATKAEARLKTTHGLTAAETRGLKPFAPDDLHRLEFAFETMSDAELQVVKGSQMARQNVLIEIVNRRPTPAPKTAGITRQHGTDRTVTIFDGASSNDERLFIGGAAGVRFSGVMTYVHEFGHVLAFQSGLQKPFDDFVKAHHIKPITWYASSNPVSESFPEAFAVFQEDPEWMQTNLPELFAWFTEVKKTGKVPVTP